MGARHGHHRDVVILEVDDETGQPAV
jgi:hypothetical protein